MAFHKEDHERETMTGISMLFISIPLLAGATLVGRGLMNGQLAEDFGLLGQRVRQGHRRTANRIANKDLPAPGSGLIDMERPLYMAELAGLLVAGTVLALEPTIVRAFSAVLIGGVSATALFLLTVRSLGAREIQSIKNDLPGTAHLLSLLLESGLGPSAALLEITRTYPESRLTARLHGIIEARSLGIPRTETLDREKKIVPLEEYHLFLNLLLQGERLGVGLSRGLRELSMKLVEDKAHRAEAIAQKASVKLLLPLVLFIFPAVFIIILSPIVLAIFGRNGGSGYVP